MDSKTITINNKEYEVRELPMSEMWPLLESGANEISKHLVRKCVYSDGVLLGDTIENQVGFRAYKKLIDASNEINGLADEEEDEEGKD